MSSKIGVLYVEALNASSPVLIFLALGVLVMVFELYGLEEYRLMSGVAFSVGLSIRCIFVLAVNKLYQVDWLVVAVLVIIFLIICAATAPIVFIYRKPCKFQAYTSIVAILAINNSVITGIPVLDGIYDKQMVSKYAYVQMLPCFLFCMIPILILFELSNNPERIAQIKENQKQKQGQKENPQTENTQATVTIVQEIKNKVILTEQQKQQQKERQEQKQKAARHDKIKKAFVPVAKALLKSIESPLVIGMVVGLIFNGILQPINAHFPNFMDYMFEYQGFIAAPLGLLMIGMYLYKEFFEIGYRQYKKRQEKKQHEENNHIVETHGIEVQPSVEIHHIETVQSQPETPKKSKQHKKCKMSEQVQDIIIFIIMSIYIQLMKHIVTPLLFIIISKGFNITDRVIVELNSIMWAQPTAVYSFVLCTQYGYGQGLAGFESVFGIFTSFLVIPMLQVYTRSTYGVE